MKKIILIGAGGHCVSCVDVIELQHKFKIVGLIDNKKEKFLLDYKIIGSDKKLKKLSKRIQYALITVGHIKNSKIRENLFKKVLNYGFKFPTIVSPLSYVSKRATIGEGTIVMHGSIINAGAKIEGEWPAQGYDFNKSLGLKPDGKHIYGLGLDEENQSELHDVRLEKWFEMLLSIFNIRNSVNLASK